MIDNLADYCYQLVDVNKKLLDLKIYDKDHKFLIDNLDKYIASQPKIKQQLNILYEHIYKKIDSELYVNKKTLNESCNTLNNKYNKYKSKYLKPKF